MDNWHEVFRVLYKKIFPESNFTIIERSDNYWLLKDTNTKMICFSMFASKPRHKGDVIGLNYHLNRGERAKIIRIIDEYHLEIVFEFIRSEYNTDFLEKQLIKYETCLGLQRDKKIDAILE